MLEKSVSLNAEGSYTHSKGESISESEMLHVGGMGFDVKPRHRIKCEITAKKCTADIPYKADAVFKDGNKKFTKKISGVYTGVNVIDTNTKLIEHVPI